MSRKRNPNSKSTPEDRCGYCGCKINEVKDGVLVEFTYTCKQWKICDNCFRIHRNYWRRFVLEMADSGKLYLETFEYEAEATLKKVSRYIQESGSKGIVFRAEEKIYLFHTCAIVGGLKTLVDELTNNDAEDFWNIVTRTKDGRRISKIGFPKAIKENIEGFEQVTTIAFQTDAPDDEEAQIWSEARIAAGNPDPHTREEEKEALQIIVPIFEKILIEQGYNVTLFLRVKRWYRNNVTWKPLSKVTFPIMYNQMRV